VSAAEVAKSWNDHYGCVSDCGEALTEGYVDTCIYVKTKVMIVPELHALLIQDVEENGHKCFFDTAAKMRLIAQKTLAKPGTMSYVFRMMHRMFKSNIIGHQSVRELDGKDSCKKGLIEQLVYLHGLVTYILGDWMRLQTSAFKFEEQNLMKKLFDFD
jgi:hypothetical protein